MDESSLMGRKRKPLSQLTTLAEDTSLVAKKKRSNGIQSERRAGTIIRMILKNFMCHSLLDVDLTSNINIIIGQNGSGKSAILTALIVGLGGKASLTNRGTSIKGFVKAGRTSGSVEIQLYNGGPMAYRPNVYGSQITIIRHFTANGASSYKIKSENGEVIASQVREIHNITTSLNIQVDNPVCILNQDTSRNFLSSNNPAHKFMLFMKATRLETLAEEYKKTGMNKKESLRLYEDRQTNYKKLQEEMKTIKRKIDNHKSIVSIRDKLKLNQIELLWAKVRDAEEDLAKDEGKVGNLQKKHQNALNECASRAEKIQNIKENVKLLNQQISELKERIHIQARPQGDVKRVIEELRTKYAQKRQEKQLISSNIQSKTRDADLLKSEIENANENMTRVEQEKMQRLRDLNSMNEKIKGMEDHLQTSRNDLYQLSSDISRREEEKQALRREISQIDSKINNEKNSLNALKNESGNTLLLYGRDMPRVKQLIEKNKHKFSKVPRGPLGSYIKLKDKKWAVAVESFLSPALLGTFTVDNKKDNQLLMQIFNQVWPSGGRKPAIVTSQFFDKRHDVRQYLVRAPQDCLSIYEAVEIDDPVVANCIVDQAGIEGILLIPNDDRAIELLSNATNVPRNCKQGVTIKGDKYFPDPNYKTYGSRYHRAQYLQVDTKEHIIQLEHNIKELMDKKRDLENQYNDISVDIRDQDNKKRQLEEKIRKLHNARSEIRRRLEELKATAEPEVANVELLESELSEVRNIIQEKTAQLGRTDEALKEIKVQINENEDKLKQLKAANSGLEERMRALESQVEEDNIRQREISTSEEFDKRRVKDVENKLNEARSQMVLKQMKLQEYTEQAGNVGERQENLRKVAEIAAEIEQLERSVRRIETDAGNTEELVEKYNEMFEKLNNVSKVLSALHEDIKELTTSIEQRTRHYKLTEDYFVTFIKHSFKKILEVRHFKGHIEINLLHKKLELIVIPQHGTQGLTNTSNLSGGERSFSTVAFLYSLWQCMEFPFYFLDEFDVYMDKLNRTTVFEILIHHAESRPKLQFIFLTPQDISFVKKKVSILRLQDPERNNI